MMNTTMKIRVQKANIKAYENVLSMFGDKMSKEDIVKEIELKMEAIERIIAKLKDEG